ncbi:MAG: phosphotransferase [Chitinophagaceae bacterium]|nr:phosphotransferase [Chitinophagaceae bacterium]
MTATYLDGPADSIELLPQSGSDRRYFRVKKAGKTYIATFNLNIPENNTFIYFSEHFFAQGLAVPQILATHPTGTAYLQQDLGQSSLLNILESDGYTDEVKHLFAKSLATLARLQVTGDAGLDYNRCLTAKEFGKQAILSDLLYFKYYFLDTLQRPYDKQALIDDFDALATYLTHTEYKFFMFRDFQSRNIMIQQGEPFFIDYQGGMKGAPQYDVASMLWQARANLSDSWKTDLLNGYMDSLDNLLPRPMNREVFKNQYYGYVLIRLLQVLGAYGFRGLFERKAHFLASIPLALRNLKWFVENRPLGIIVPEFKKVLDLVISEEVIEKFTPLQASEATPFTVYVNSFSYKKNGYPADESDNGGGFVFDCRGILNPGRIDEYKTKSGKDKEVIDYLEQRTRMPEFLNSVFDIVDINVEDYLKRGFDRLMINFGCTGGQHRSVYAAEQTARHLRNKYKVKTVVQHLNTQNWKKD